MLYCLAFTPEATIPRVQMYIYFFFQVEGLYYELNYHDQKIWQTLRATYGNTGQLFRPY